jgi:hypothetical protein
MILLRVTVVSLVLIVILVVTVVSLALERIDTATVAFLVGWFLVIEQLVLHRILWSSFCVSSFKLLVLAIGGCLEGWVLHKVVI